MKFIYQHKNWPKFIWDDARLLPLLGEVRQLQGRLLGSMEHLGFALKTEAMLETLTLDALKTSEIEGEILRPASVRSSVARKLGVEVAGVVEPDLQTDGLVEMLLDATQNFQAPLTKSRLVGWQQLLFPSGQSGNFIIKTGVWRDDSTGPMQVVSGPLGREKVHFQAPAAKELAREMSVFLKWCNSKNGLDPVLKAGVAHLWFITLHPFDDGNGRLARALTDQLLARADGVAERFYSMSAQIQAERKSYYEILEQTQKSDMDITEWLVWFLECLGRALNASKAVLKKVIAKHKFWSLYGKDVQNDRQKQMLNLLLDDFRGKLTTTKWAKITKCSPDTALRDIQDLMQKGILKKADTGGRSSNYLLTEE